MADIGCAGILVADTFCGPLDALPEEGQLLMVDALPARSGGCAANAAVALAKQGIAVDVAGCVGRDPAAEVVRSELEKHGVGISQVVATDSEPTSSTVILLVRGQDRRYIHTFGANKAFSAAHIDRAWLTGLKLFYVGGLFALPGLAVDELLHVLQDCRRNDVATVVDVVLPPDHDGYRGLEKLFPYIDIFTPNDDEARQLTGRTEPLEQIRAMQDAGARTVIVTQGEAGATAADGPDAWHVDAFKQVAVDPSGAGDAFTAGVIAGLYRGWDMNRMLACGAALGASATRAVGTTEGIFTAEETEAFLASNPVEARRLSGISH